MLKIPREYLLLVERVLREYPERLRELKTANAERQKWLERHIAMVRDGLRLLRDDEREVVKLLFWDELPVWQTAEIMETYEKAIWRAKTRGLQKLAPLFMPNLMGPA